MYKTLKLPLSASGEMVPLLSAAAQKLELISISLNLPGGLFSSPALQGLDPIPACTGQDIGGPETWQ